jgi:hypothetical protein
VGWRLIEADDLAGLRRAHRSAARSARTAAPELLPSLADILDKALERDPADRYATAAQMAEDLDACAEGRPLPHTRPRGTIARIRDALRRRPRAAAAIAILAMAGAAAGGSTWHAQRITTVACAEIVERNGMPECLDPTPGGAAGVRYRIESRIGRVVRMLREDAGGRPLPVMEDGPEQGVVEWRFEPGGDRCAGGSGHDASGARIVTWSYQRGAGDARVVDKKYTVEDSPREGRRQVLDLAGFVLEERFQNALGVEAANASGVWGYLYQRDARGKVLGKKAIVSQ